MRRIEDYAKKTFLALKNPYHTVIHVEPGIIDQITPVAERYGYAWYIGIKNTDAISHSLRQRLAEAGFLPHTIDKMAYGGRAIDLQLVNPITGRWMTGSSSGTALNVFYGMNDVGIGTDGGGSVLAPAAALNLFGFISPLIEHEFLKQHKKRSTDGIEFHPSIGVIARELLPLKKIMKPLLQIEEDDMAEIEAEQLKREETDCPDINGSRNPLIEYLRRTVVSGEILISQEGPVDFYGMGDTIFGHFDESTAKIQSMSGKGLMRAVNMSGKSAMVIPAKELGICTLLICESRKEEIGAMFRLAESLQTGRSPLMERYFLNLDMYF